MDLKTLQERMQEKEKPLPLQEVLIDIYKEIEKVKAACLLLKDQIENSGKKL